MISGVDTTVNNVILVQSKLFLGMFHRILFLAPLKIYFKVSVIYQAPAVQKVDMNAIHGNQYPLDSAIGFPKTYPLDSDLSCG